MFSFCAIAWCERCFPLGNKQTQKQIDEIVKLFNNQHQQLEGESLRHLMVSNIVYLLVYCIL